MSPQATTTTQSTQAKTTSPLVSYYKGGVYNKPGTPTRLGIILKAIKVGRWAKSMAYLRVAYKEDQKKYQKDKATMLPAFATSGQFKGLKHRDQDFTEHSGIYSYDFDHLSDGELEQLGTWRHESLFALFLSPSGCGYKVFMRGPIADSPSDHKRKWLQIGAEVRGSTRLAERFDPTSCNVSRLCFVSSDPNLYINYDAVEFAVGEGEAVEDDLDELDVLDGADEEDEGEDALADYYLTERDPSVTIDDIRGMLEYVNPWTGRPEWMKTAMALKHQLGDQGNVLFHEWSKGSVGEGVWDGEDTYIKADADKLWKSISNSVENNVTIAYVRNRAKEGGWKPQGKVDQRWRDRLLRKKPTKEQDAAGQPGDVRSCRANMQIMLLYAPLWSGKITFGEWEDRYFFGDKDTPLADHHITQFCYSVEEFMGFSPGTMTAYEVMIEVGRLNSFHRVKDWLEAIEWDGQNRIQQLFQRGWGVEDNALVQAYGLRFMVSLIARVYKPGCKVDTMPVLTGGQGHGKSSIFAALVGEEYFGEGHLDLSGYSVRSAQERIQGKWVWEDSELTTLHKGEVNTLKSFLSTANDRFRPSYGKVAVDHPRVTVFVGSGNDTEFLRDQTGNRRYWPMRIGEQVVLDSAMEQEARVTAMKWVKDNRDQLFAEALDWYRRGCQWWLTKEEEELHGNDVREYMVEAPWQSAVEGLLEGEFKDCEVIVVAQLNAQLELTMSTGFNPFVARDVAAFLKVRYGYEKRIKKIKGKATRIYER